MNAAPNIIGRQPEVCYFTPSKPNPWYGTIIEGRRYTGEQLRALDALKVHPDKVASITVRRNATTREMWWPQGGTPPQYEFECPVRVRRGDRVQVISPAGLHVWINADGTTAGASVSYRKGSST